MDESLEIFYENLLGIKSPWEVTSVTRDSTCKEITVVTEIKAHSALHCPVCGCEAKGYDHRTRRWRHLDSCNHKTIMEAPIPRIDCPEHGVKQVPVTWAEENPRFTLEFETIVLLWLKDDPISTVARNFDLSWDQIAGIMDRAVKRGLRRRNKTSPFQKRHEYVTVILDKDSDTVIDIFLESLAGGHVRFKRYTVKPFPFSLIPVYMGMQV